jgi:hypothetical protein
MPRVLIGNHAEDVGGGRVVEPGQPIPADADPAVIARLEADGRVRVTRKPKSKTAPTPTEED